MPEATGTTGTTGTTEATGTPGRTGAPATTAGLEAALTRWFGTPTRRA
jgi:hypothetical protein